MTTTRQTIFDKVSKHLMKQGSRAVKNDICQYRAEGGLKCAIGCLISDKMYNPEMEDKTIGQLIKKWPSLPHYFKKYLTFLTKLQALHDNRYNWKSPDRLKQALADFAVQNHLKFDREQSLMSQTNLSKWSFPMHSPVNILGLDYQVEYDYRVTAEAIAPSGPSYACGGEPGEPMEFDITIVGLTRDGENLFVPRWLRDQLEQFLLDSSTVAEEIERDHSGEMI